MFQYQQYNAKHLLVDKKNNNTSGILLAKLERRPVANMTIFDDAYNIYLFVDESCRTCGFSKKKKKVIASNIK